MDELLSAGVAVGLPGIRVICPACTGVHPVAGCPGGTAAGTGTAPPGGTRGCFWATAPRAPLAPPLLFAGPFRAPPGTGAGAGAGTALGATRRRPPTPGWTAALALALGSPSETPAAAQNFSSASQKVVLPVSRVIFLSLSVSVGSCRTIR